MAEFSYIHISLRGPAEGGTRTLYTYPADASDTPAWDTLMVEPGAAVKRFLNASECYVLQSSEAGHYLSLIARAGADPSAWMMVSVLVDNGASLTGRQAVEMLTNLRKCLIDDNDLREEAVDVALIESQVPRLPVELLSWTWTAPAAEAGEEGGEPEEAGYRTYMSPKELEQVFAFPSQPEYDRFRCVLVVPATASLRPGVKMPRITVPIRRQYTVECPEDVTVSADTVYDGDSLTITYHKEGYDSHKETVEVGRPSAYTKAEGPRLMIRTALQTGIRFVRRVRVKVVSAKGGDLRGGYTITLNGRLINTMTPYIDFTPRDLPEGEDVEIKVESNNYKPLKLVIPSAEILTSEELVLELQPVEQTVTLRLDFGDGRVFNQDITIEKNTPEYNRLHSGNFHGFRAHRQVTTDRSEVYNVDVRLTNPPVAPNFDTGRDKHAAPEGERLRSPQFENISDDNPDDRPHVDTTLPTRDLPEEPDITSATDGDDEEYAPVPLWRRKGVVAAVAAVVVLIAAWLLFGRGGATEGDDLIAAGDSTAVVAGDTAQAQTGPAAPAAPPTADEAADIEYLNTNASWQPSKLRSPMGTALAAALADGDLRALAENDYFAVKGRCTNQDALKVVEMAWAAIGSPNEQGNRRRVRDAAKGGDIVLHKLMEAMAKVRPSENVNNTPRPQK